MYLNYHALGFISSIVYPNYIGSILFPSTCKYKGIHLSLHYRSLVITISTASTTTMIAFMAKKKKL